MLVNPEHFFFADHEQLLYKLRTQGLGLLAVNWFCNYLNNSCQLLFSKGLFSAANGSWHPPGIHLWANSNFSLVNDFPSVCHSILSMAVLKILIINIRSCRIQEDYVFILQLLFSFFPLYF